MKNKKLKIGVVGGGVNSAVGRAHFCSLNIDGLWEVVAGTFSRDKSINRASGEFWHVSELHNDIDSLVATAKNDLDAFLVLSPTPAHFEHIKKLSALGKPIICEKSVAVSYEEALRIENLSNQKQFDLYVTFNYTGYPMVRELKKRIEKGVYGQVHNIQVSMHQDGFSTLQPDGKPKQIQNWRKIDYELPTISLDLGVHVVNLLEYILSDRFQSLVSVENHFGKISNAIDNVSCLGKSRQSTNISISYGKIFLGKKNEFAISIFGENGSVSWNQERPNEIVEADVYGECRLINLATLDLLEATKERYMRFKAGHPAGFIEAFANHYFDIYSAILGRQSPHVFGIKEALTGLNTLTAVHRSANLGQWVSVDESGELSNK
jgi:predicted dehydrogenase